MGMLNGVADVNKQFQPRAGPQGTLVAEIGDFNTLDQFHYEIRTAALSRAGIEDASDVRMVHQRQCLSLGLKTCNHALGVHPRLNQLEGDAPVDRFRLFGYEDYPATPFSDLLQQLVPVHPVT